MEVARAWHACARAARAVKPLTAQRLTGRPMRAAHGGAAREWGRRSLAGMPTPLAGCPSCLPTRCATLSTTLSRHRAGAAPRARGHIGARTPGAHVHVCDKKPSKHRLRVATGGGRAGGGRRNQLGRFRCDRNRRATGRRRQDGRPQALPAALRAAGPGLHDAAQPRHHGLDAHRCARTPFAARAPAPAPRACFGRDARARAARRRRRDRAQGWRRRACSTGSSAWPPSTPSARAAASASSSPAASRPTTRAAATRLPPSCRRAPRRATTRS